jgi:hypothetical protein
MVHRCATLVCGATRHRAIEPELLRTQIESTLFQRIWHSRWPSTDCATHLVQTLQDRVRQTTRPAATAQLLRAAVRARPTDRLEACLRMPLRAAATAPLRP